MRLTHSSRDSGSWLKRRLLLRAPIDRRVLKQPVHSAAREGQLGFAEQLADALVNIVVVLVQSNDSLLARQAHLMRATTL